MQTFMVPCLLGLEKLVGDEIRRLGLRDVQVENGRVLCRGQLSDIARLNINLRCGARVLLVLGRFPARSFEELFQGTRAIARDNARKAGVEDVVRFEVADMRNFRREDTYGQLVTNPPYGERLLERQEAEALYRDFGHMWERLPDTWRTLVLSSHTEFERTFGHQAKKKRKLYNGMIKCDLFMYGNV